jgi:hypothetical protein
MKELVATLHKAGSSGDLVDMQPFLFEFTLNTATMLLFGEPHGSLP